MTPSIVMTDTTPLVHKHPQQYRIAPRNWGVARQQYSDFYEEATYHRDVGESEDGCHEYDYFEMPISCGTDDTTEIGAVASHLRDSIFHHPLLRLRVTESDIAGPAGTMSVKIEIIDKLKFSGKDYKKTKPESLCDSTKTAAMPRLSDLKLDDTPSSVTWCVRQKDLQLEVRLPGSKTALNPAGTFVPISNLSENRVIAFTRESSQRLKRAARDFAGVSASTAEEAEHAIDREIERRIVAERVRQTEPIHPGFWTIPKKYVEKIFKYAMNIHGSVYPYAYSGEHGGFAFFYPQSRAPQPLALRSVEAPAWVNSEKHSFRGATAEALYGHTTFVFTLPKRAHRWIAAIPADCPWLLKKIELHLETDVSLAYYQQFLGFTYDRDTYFMRDALNGHGADELFKALASGCQELKRLNLVFPSVWRMYYSGAAGTCHFMLCKWLAKAMGTCAANYPKIKRKVILQSYKNSDSTRDMGIDKMSELQAIFDDPTKTTWFQLGIEELHEFRSRPPLCECDILCPGAVRATTVEEEEDDVVQVVNW